MSTKPFRSTGFELEGQRLLAVEVGHTDTDDTTVLHVPSIGLVVAGDVVYNGVHQYLLESAHGGIEAWLHALNKVAALHPRAVVAGHKNKDLPDDPAILDQTRDYLLDAQRLLADKPSPREFFRPHDPPVPGSAQRRPGLVQRRGAAVLTDPTSSIRDEVTRWFFDDYLPTWIGVGAGTIERGPEFILDYWAAPLHWSDDQGSQWLPGRAGRGGATARVADPAARRGLRAHLGARPQSVGLSRQRRGDRGDLVTSSRRRHRDRASGRPLRGGTRDPQDGASSAFRRSPQPATR